jgi:hypothetical protein
MGLFSFFRDLSQLIQKVNAMSTALQNLTAAVAANKSVTDSAITLLGGLKSQLDALIAAGSDPTALQALSDSLGAETQALADAVSTNTPVAPPAA